MIVVLTLARLSPLFVLIGWLIEGICLISPLSEIRVLTKDLSIMFLSFKIFQMFSLLIFQVCFQIRTLIFPLT